MKANTKVWAGIRNVGDSTDGGQIFSGTVSESIMWLAKQLGAMSMKQRFVIGIGRDETGARMALTDKRMTQEDKREAANKELMEMLESIIPQGEDYEEETDQESNTQTQKIEGDNWIEPA